MDFILSLASGAPVVVLIGSVACVTGIFWLIGFVVRYLTRPASVEPLVAQRSSEEASTSKKEDKKSKEKKDKSNKKSVKKSNKEEQAKAEKSPKNGAAKNEQDKQTKKSFGVAGGMSCASFFFFFPLF